MEFKLSIRLSEPAQGLLPRTDSDFRGAPRRILRNEIGIVYKGLQLAFGSNLPKVRARLVVDQLVETQSREVVLTFPKPHRPRRRATVGSRQALGFNDNEGDEINCGVLLGPQSR